MQAYSEKKIINKKENNKNIRLNCAWIIRKPVKPTTDNRKFIVVPCLVLLQSSEGAWDKIFDINVKAAYLLSKEVLPHLRKRGGGSIVYISSIAGFQPIEVMYIIIAFKCRCKGKTF